MKKLPLLEKGRRKKYNISSRRRMYKLIGFYETKYKRFERHKMEEGLFMKKYRSELDPNTMTEEEFENEVDQRIHEEAQRITGGNHSTFLPSVFSYAKAIAIAEGHPEIKKRVCEVFRYDKNDPAVDSLVFEIVDGGYPTLEAFMEDFPYRLWNRNLELMRLLLLKDSKKSSSIDPGL